MEPFGYLNHPPLDQQLQWNTRGYFPMMPASQQYRPMHPNHPDRWPSMQRPPSFVDSRFIDNHESQRDQSQTRNNQNYQTHGVYPLVNPTFRPPSSQQCYPQQGTTDRIPPPQCQMPQSNPSRHSTFGGAQEGTHDTRMGYQHPANEKLMHNNSFKKNKGNKRRRQDCLFFCEACARGYNSKTSFIEHNATHVRCTVEGCDYSASDRLVKSHYQAAHRTVGSATGKQLESSEDIEKWRQARRKNFPTAQNITNKQMDRAGKVGRGEVLVNEPVGKMKKASQKNACVESGQINLEERPPVKQEKIIEDEADKDLEQGKTPTEVVDDEATRIDEKEIQKNSRKPILSNQKKQRTRKRSRCKLKVDGNNPQRPKKGSRHSVNNQFSVHQLMKPRQSLLQKLLASDIRHERNAILQCVRYIVRNQFLTPQET